MLGERTFREPVLMTSRRNFVLGVAPGQCKW